MRIYGNDHNLSGIWGKSLGYQAAGLRVGGRKLESGSVLKTSSTEELSLEESQAVSTIRDGFERIGKVMQGMKLISEKGEESLSEDERLLLQSRMAEFQSDLHREIHSVALKLAGKTYESTLPTDGAKSIVGEGVEGSDEYGFYGCFLDLSSDQSLNKVNLGNLGLDGLRIFGARKLDPEEGAPMINGDTVHYVTLVATGKGNVLESHTDKLISALAEAGESGKSLSEVASEPMFAQDDMMLIDPERSGEITDRIDDDLKKIWDMSAKFEEFVEKMKSSDSGGARKDLSVNRDLLDLQNKVDGPLGTMAFSLGADFSDLRMIDVTSPLGQMFSEVDSLFKDDIYSDLGVEDTYFRDLIFDMDDSALLQELFDQGRSSSRVSI
ncbi:hypothetical protein L2W58_10230 [Dethiosulfovibrio sp. F2B]|uniref:hypothetical protein n=1 Tax=Dethiosulfovibrio faecalis TaxID=2720018 RepID=UPI001F4074CD|nr:hypothetical protein [Dethiosulfovibrio faecalis]MCF4152174.1 hypothetical protein [Dethiosulfovibrio faecalis]